MNISLSMKRHDIYCNIFNWRRESSFIFLLDISAHYLPAFLLDCCSFALNSLNQQGVFLPKISLNIPSMTAFHFDKPAFNRIPIDFQWVSGSRILLANLKPLYFLR